MPSQTANMNLSPLSLITECESPLAGLPVLVAEDSANTQSYFGAERNERVVKPGCEPENLSKIPILHLHTLLTMSGIFKLSLSLFRTISPTSNVCISFSYTTASVQTISLNKSSSMTRSSLFESKAMSLSTSIDRFFITEEMPCNWSAISSFELSIFASIPL